MDDEYLDYELGLPPALRTISNQEKKELFEFKQLHSNLEWEEVRQHMGTHTVYALTKLSLYRS